MYEKRRKGSEANLSTSCVSSWDIDLGEEKRNCENCIHAISSFYEVKVKQKMELRIRKLNPHEGYDEISNSKTQAYRDRDGYSISLKELLTYTSMLLYKIDFNVIKIRSS